MPLVVRRPPLRLLVAAPLLATLTLTGCGGGDDEPKGPVASPSAPDLAPSARVEIARGLYTDNDPGTGANPLISAEESRCIADALVKSFGVDGLIRLRVIDRQAIYRSVPSAIPPEEAGQWVDGFDGCIDIADYALAVARTGVRELAPKYGDDDAAWAKARTCLDEADPDASRAVLIESLTAKPDADGPRTEFAACVKLAYPDATA